MQRRYFPLWKIMFKPIFVIILGNEMSLQYALKYCMDLIHLRSIYLPTYNILLTILVYYNVITQNQLK